MALIANYTLIEVYLDHSMAVVEVVVFSVAIVKVAVLEFVNVIVAFFLGV